jgi:hypothetical protein
LIKYYCFKEVEKSELNGKSEIKKHHKFLNESIQKKITYFIDKSTNKEYINYFDKVYFEVEVGDKKFNKCDFFACYIPSEKKDITNENISNELRGTKTLNIDDINCYDNTDIKVVFSENGFAFISKFDEQKDKFERIYILYLLAHTYNSYTEKTIVDVSNSYNSKELQKMLDLRKEIYIFDLNYFFANPVNYKKQQLHTIWTYLNSIYKIEKNREEMKSQVKDLVELIEIELKEIAEEKNKSKTFWLAIFGLLITMFSLVSAYKDIKEMGWINNENSISEKKDK